MINTDIQYHTIDGRWEIFGCLDYNTFLDRFVIKGLFHKDVPKDIVESYILVEYIMAHAYYHYPLYDEALSKLLRITEMAVKLKCKQLNIPLEAPRTDKNGNTRMQKLELNSLINSISKHEPFREIKDKLHSVRSIRNSFMHPEHYSYAGITRVASIKGIVVLLNKLFLPEQCIRNNQQHTKGIQKKVKSFTKGPIVLEFNNKKYLISDVNIYDSAFIQGEWFYYLVCNPVITDFKQQTENNKIFPPFKFFIRSLSVNGKNIIADCLSMENPIIINPTDNLIDIEKHKDFLNQKSLVNQENLASSESFIRSDIGQELISFQHNFYWQSVS